MFKLDEFFSLLYRFLLFQHSKAEIYVVWFNPINPIELEQLLQFFQIIQLRSLFVEFIPWGHFIRSLCFDNNSK